MVFALLLPVLLGACASKVPLAIREPITAAPDVQQARATQGELTGQRVRWGGEIASVENNKQDTWIEIVDRPLAGDGRPRDSDKSGGRFIARIPGFLDPAIYEKDRELTVNGVLAASITRPVGSYPYRYPVVDVEQYYLWAKRLPVTNYPYYYDPFWRDPWYGPWWYAPHPRYRR